MSVLSTYMPFTDLKDAKAQDLLREDSKRLLAQITTSNLTLTGLSERIGHLENHIICTKAAVGPYGKAKRQNKNSVQWRANKSSMPNCARCPRENSRKVVTPRKKEINLSEK